jgi:hypothetical protein
MDAAGVRNNALAFNQANGVAVSINAAYTTLLYCDVPYTVISRIQLRNTSMGGGANMVVHASGGAAGIKLQDLIADTIGAGNASNGVLQLAAPATVRNVVAVQRGAASGIMATTTAVIVGSTVVRPLSVGAAQTGIVSSYTLPTVQSTAVFGFAAATSGNFGGTSRNNATDAASGLPGSGNVHGVAWNASTPFREGSSDFRAAAGSALAGAGYRDTSIAPNDISGTPRPAAPTIGAWELATAATVTARRRLIQ